MKSLAFSAGRQGLAPTVYNLCRIIEFGPEGHEDESVS